MERWPWRRRLKELRVSVRRQAQVLDLLAERVAAGPLPRDEMVLMLWGDDPDHPECVIEWARELNPPMELARFQ